MAAFVVTMSKTPPAQGDKCTCKHYCKYGHEEANCFELIGYPAGWFARGGVCGHGRGCGGREGEPEADMGLDHW